MLEGKIWLEPFFGPASMVSLAEYGLPFWLPGKTEGEDDPDGVIFGNLSTEKIKSLIKFEDKNISYFFLLSKQGRFIYHPQKEFVLSHRTIFENAWKS